MGLLVGDVLLIVSCCVALSRLGEMSRPTDAVAILRPPTLIPASDRTATGILHGYKIAPDKTRQGPTGLMSRFSPGAGDSACPAGPGLRDVRIVLCCWLLVSLACEKRPR